MDERPQYGIIVKNSSHQTLPLSADNFISTMKSYVFSAGLKGKPSLMFDWVRENPNTLTTYIKDDLSLQVVVDNQVYNLAQQPVQGNGNVTPANSTNQVNVYVNNVKVEVIGLEGQRVILARDPPLGSTVRAEYYVRTLLQAGFYYFELISPTQVMVDPLYLFDQIIIPEATGSEASYTLPFTPYNNSLEFVEGDRVLLVEGVHYTLAGTLVTFLPNPADPFSGEKLRHGQSYRAIFRHQGASLGPFDVKPLNTTDILPGVTTAFSYFLEVGDKQVVVITDTREEVANEFGGNFETSLTLDVYARDPVQREIIADLVVVKIFGELKPIFDHSGLLVVGVNISGESEPSYEENTDTPYFMTSIDVQLTTDWRLYAPILPKIKYFEVDVEMVESINNFKVSFIPGKEDYK